MLTDQIRCQVFLVAELAATTLAGTKKGDSWGKMRGRGMERESCFVLFVWLLLSFVVCFVVAADVVVVWEFVVLFWGLVFCCCFFFFFGGGEVFVVVCFSCFLVWVCFCVFFLFACWGGGGGG